MRILALVCNENTYQPLVYEELFKARGTDFVGLVLVPFTTKAMPKQRLLRFLWDLYGLKGFLFKGARVLRNKLLNLVSAVVPLRRCYSLRRLTRRYDVPLFETADLGSEECLELVRGLQPDVILSSQGHMVGKRLLEIPRLGVINKHAGMLPRYRGLYPVFWAMLNGETEIGVTVHFMNEKLDDGDLLLQEALPILKADTFETMYRKVIEVTPRLLLRALELLETGTAAPKPNDASQGSSFSLPTRDDIRRFRQAGRRIL